VGGAQGVGITHGTNAARIDQDSLADPRRFFPLHKRVAIKGQNLSQQKISHASPAFFAAKVKAFRGSGKFPFSRTLAETA
jgi:uncharacterized Fe-S cluster-containing radical SAM superfamily protein